MKIISYLNIVLIVAILSSCSKVTAPVKEIGLGSRDINYQADEKVGSLIIPPDLTEPSSLQALTEVEEIVDENQVVQSVQNVEIKRDKYRRWLLVDLPPSDVWALSKEFFRQWLIQNDFQGKEGQKLPEISDNVVMDVSKRYIELFDKITGSSFKPRNSNDIISDLKENIISAIS